MKGSPLRYPHNLHGAASIVVGELQSTLASLTKQIVAFRDARDWRQFHNLRDLAISLNLEASEVMELFQWCNDTELPNRLQERHEDLQRELADVLYWVLLMAHDAEVDLAKAFQSKMEENATKYPEDQARGRATKYTGL